MIKHTYYLETSVVSYLSSRPSRDQLSASRQAVTHAMTVVNTPMHAYPRRKDPILQELWDTKAKLNSEAGYDVSKLLANARKAVQILQMRGLVSAS